MSPLNTIAVLLLPVLTVAGLLPNLAAAQASIVTPAFFNGITSGAGSWCAGKGFYTYQSFLNAAASFPSFGNVGNAIINRRELAAFFANVKHETGSFCYIQEINKSNRYCDRRYACPVGKSYYGRGPLQLTWNYNYQAAGRALGFDGINTPERVATDPTLAFKTALWFWNSNSRCHSAITSGQGFAATIRAINGGECNGGNTRAVNARVQYYLQFCRQLGVSPGINLYC